MKKENRQYRRDPIDHFVINKNTDVDSFLGSISHSKKEPMFIIVDLFCGAGGTTTGFEMTKGLAKVIACVNHDPVAIESHWANHPDVCHFEEDIRTLDLSNLIKIVRHYRELYPNAKLVLWASLECTNFSKAKGGQPRDADSRTLADHLPRYITAISPDYVQIENVVEFMSWGPLKIACEEEIKKAIPAKGIYPQCKLKLFYNKKTNRNEYGWIPESKNNGRDWLRWRHEIDSFGYHNDWKELNSADFGAYTSRNRLFGCFAKKGLPIAWPTPTHSKKTDNGSLFNSPLNKWKPVKDCLDFSDEGQSIFNRKKPLVDRTLERIYAGLIKYVANGDETFLIKYNSMSQKGKYIAPNLNDPCPVISTQGRLGIANISFLVNYNHSSKVNDVGDPAPTLLTHDKLGIASPSFLAKYYGNGNNVQSTEEPAGVLTTKDRFTKVQTVWIDRNFTGGGKHSSINNPAGTIMNVPKLNLVQTKWISNFQFNNAGMTIEQPAPTLLASRRHYYIVNPAYQGHMSDTEKPCPVIVARQDKSPLQLLEIQKFNVFIPIYDTDSEIMIKIKLCMASYGIADIKIRMLKVFELLSIQGFPDTYILKGTQTDQKKFIGNSVVPLIPKVWAEAFYSKLKSLKIAA